MARPKSKVELIEASNTNFDKLMSFISSMSEKELSTEFDFSNNEKKKEAHWKRDKNVRDVLIHLYEWHKLAINWINKNKAGERVSFLPEPYTFKNYADMNVEFWKKHQDTAYEQSVEMLKASHDELIKIIDKFTNEELFTKKYFDWTGTTSVGSYLVSATSSHYDWALKKLKAHRKEIG